MNIVKQNKFQQILQKIKSNRLTRLFFIFSTGIFLLLFLCILCIFFSSKPDLYPDTGFSKIFYDKNGSVLRITLTEDEKYRIFTDLENISSDFIDATLLYEDRHFYKHFGVNPFSVVRVSLDMLTGSRRMGASTITMQHVRLSQNLDTKNIAGKIKQMWRAIILERHYTKDEILEAYLNIAPYGANIEGIGAASHIWFKKSPQNLGIAEVLALVPVPQNPVARNPLAQKGKALSEARIRLDAMWEEHNATQIKSTSSNLQSIFAQIPLQVYSTRDIPFEAPHAVNSILSDTTLTESGSHIYTSIDLNIQKRIEQIVRQYVEREQKWGMNNASILLIDWRSADIVSLVGSADFFNEEIQGQVDGTSARRSPGSTLKPFVYALALEQGLIHPQTILADTPKVFYDYAPKNADDEFRGPISATLALQNSRNIPAISLSVQLDSPSLYGFLKNAGVNFGFPEDHYGLSLVLGGAEVSMRELATLYAALANKGFLREISFISDPHKPVLPVLSPEAAYITMDMLRIPPPQKSRRSTLMPVAWKTGTSNGMRDAWTCGIFGPYVLVVWVGNFDSSPNPGFVGSKAAAPLFFEIANELYRIGDHETQKDYFPSMREDLNLIRIPVCSNTGDIRTELCEKQGFVSDTWFIPGRSPIKDSGILREIIIDTNTGLRQCQDIEGQTERIVWEFWPADMRRLFSEAGVHKQLLPPYDPACLESLPMHGGNAPIIISPHEGLIYNRSISNPKPIPLLADTDADASTLYWFADTKYLGASFPEKPLLWDLAPGVHTLRVADDLGRSSSIRVRVENIP